jgi:putative colanic acid biosynthesis UDP-glucose lipid carrier transferase
MLDFIRYGIFYENARLIANLQRLLDGLISVLLLVFLCWLYNTPFGHHYTILATISFLLIIAIFQGSRVYNPWRGVGLGQMARQIILGWVLLAGILAALGYATKTSNLFSRKVLFSWLMLVPMLHVGLRLNLYLGLRLLRKFGRNTRRVVIAGAGPLGQRLASHIKQSPWLGMTLLGFFDDRLAGQTVHLKPTRETIPVLGNLDAMVDFIREQKVHSVYLALPLRAEGRLRQVVEPLRDTTASVYFAPDVFTFSLLRARVTELEGVPLISLWETPFYGGSGWLKRAEDIFLAAIFLLSLFPVMLAIALGVKLSSPGPVIFKQRRYGLDGKEIQIYKFRTMTVCEDGHSISQATQDDARITRFGAFLRQTSLDELPQFINVLQGAMSIVGPRPHAVAHNEFYRRHIPGYMLRHKVRPGLTGWAQVNGWRGETETMEKMKKRIEYDLQYIQRWSLWLDLKIILSTVFLVLRDKRAY